MAANTSNDNSAGVQDSIGSQPNPTLTQITNLPLKPQDKERLQPTEDGDHPQGNEIRRQFEFWLSDENLPTDSHLIGLLGGSQNHPVSINEMMSWRKMRDLNHRKDRSLVISALKRSTLIEVVENDEKVRRRVPFDDELLTPELKLLAAKPKVSAPVHMTKAMLKPTGFEDDACEYPMKPAEHAEDVELYGQGTSFASRMEIAIQRYKTKRKKHQKFQQVLNPFLEFGGVDSRPRQFAGGLTEEEMSEMDAADIAMHKASHFVDADRNDDTLWAVDFEGVAKAYLSDYYPLRVQNVMGAEGFELAAGVMTNFYNYILQHNVCPEYMTDILAARAVCTRANREMPAIERVSHLLPGAFNQACSYFFDGYYAPLLGKQDWQSDDSSQAVFDPAHAQVVMVTALLTMGGDKLSKTLKANLVPSQTPDSCARSFECIQEEKDDGWELVHIEHPTKTLKKLYVAQKLNPLGKLTLQRWIVPDIAHYDLPPQSVVDEHNAKLGISKPNRIQIWLEQDILEHCFVGMKVRGTLRYMALKGEGHDVEKANGFWYLDFVSRVYASFYTSLLNELEAKELRVKFLDDVAEVDEYGVGHQDEIEDDG